MKSVCIYCGSSARQLARLHRTSENLAAQLVEHKLDLVYGGGDVGLMKAIADEVLRLEAMLPASFRKPCSIVK